MTGQETELANIFKQNPKEGIQAVERMFKDIATKTIPEISKNLTRLA